jgi:hypothetical protein
MKNLIVGAALGLALGYSGISYADTEVFGVNVPVESTAEVGDQVKGGYVEASHTSFYTTKKELNDVDYTGGDKGDADDTIIVFGVRVSDVSKI